MIVHGRIDRLQIDKLRLKRISRIRALSMIMVLCLFVYAITEYKLRQKLKEQNETIIAQTKKQTQKPTLKWVFFLFRRVREITLKIEGKLMTKVLNVDSTLEKIIRLLGRRYENYYFS